MNQHIAFRYTSGEVGDGSTVGDVKSNGLAINFFGQRLQPVYTTRPENRLVAICR